MRKGEIIGNKKTGETLTMIISEDESGGAQQLYQVRLPPRRPSPPLHYHMYQPNASLLGKVSQQLCRLEKREAYLRLLIGQPDDPEIKQHIRDNASDNNQQAKANHENFIIFNPSETLVRRPHSACRGFRFCAVFPMFNGILGCCGGGLGISILSLTALRVLSYS